jgi:hypothetical protein
MTMVWTATTDGDKPLYYTTNGTNHFSHIGMHSPEQPPEDESESSDPERYTFGQFAGCKIDTAGKPFIDEHIDRFAPAPMNAQWAYSSGMLQRADAVLNKELIDLWDEYPQIIGDLMTLGPVIFVNGVHLLFRSTVAKEIATRVRANVNPPEATALIAKQAKIDLHGEWSSITVRAEETDDDETEVDRVFEKSADAERRHMRALIRKSVGKRVPSLDWIEKHLSALGTVHTKKRKGGTSHQWITLTRNGETHKYSTSPSIRSTDSLDFKILWSVLHTLRISAEEFYEECRRDKVS